MWKKYSLSQFSAKYFSGYKEVTKRELVEWNRFGMIELFCGVNIFFQLFPYWISFQWRRYFINYQFNFLYFISNNYASNLLCI